MNYRTIFKDGYHWPQYRSFFGLKWKYMTQNDEFTYKYVEQSDAKARIAKFKSDRENK